MADKTGGRFFMDKNRYFLDWLIDERIKNAGGQQEDSEKRINTLISILSRDTKEKNVLPFKLRKK